MKNLLYDLIINSRGSKHYLVHVNKLQQNTKFKRLLLIKLFYMKFNSYNTSKIFIFEIYSNIFE